MKFNYDEQLNKFDSGDVFLYSPVFNAATNDFFLKYGEFYTNRYSIWQYDRPLEYWYASLRKDNIESVLDTPRSKKKLLNFLDAVAQYDTCSEPDHYKSIYAEKVRKILNERPIPSQLQALWEEAKSKVES